MKNIGQMQKKESENGLEGNTSGNGIVTKWDRAADHPHPGAESVGGQKGRGTGGGPRETGGLEGQGRETDVENVTEKQERGEGQVILMSHFANRTLGLNMGPS